MPVSLERLIAEVEPAVITDELIRDCIMVSMLAACTAAGPANRLKPNRTADQLQVSGDPESAEDKKQSLAFGQVECAAFSFRSLARIGNLWGLTKLVKLQLDNNQIQRIENLEHLVSNFWSCMMPSAAAAWMHVLCNATVQACETAVQ
jgi:hypothetical protein